MRLVRIASGPAGWPTFMDHDPDGAIRDSSAAGHGLCWILAVAALALTLFSPGVLNDGDTFLHIAAGRWMIGHGSVLHADPFSYTLAGATWVTHEWLAELVLAAAFLTGGWSGVLLVAGLAMAAAVLVLGRHLARFLPPAAVAFLVVAAFACATPGLLARPHVLALPLLVGWCCGLLDARDRSVAPPWRLLPLMTLWANLHGSFLFGLLLVVPLGVEAALSGGRQWGRPARRWAGFLAGAVLASLATPHGVTGLLFPVRLMRMHELAGISEWRPADFTVLQPPELLLLAGLYGALSRGFRLPPVRLLMLLGVLHLALQHSRHQMLAGFIVPLLIARPLGRVLRPSQQEADSGIAWAPVALICMACLMAIRLAVPLMRVDGATAPISALARVPADLARQPVFNDYDFGGFLAFSGVRPFIDGRADLYGDAFLRQYGAVTHPDKAVAEQVFRTYGVAWTMLAVDNPAVGLLDAMPQWCRFYADRYAVVHVPAGSGYCGREAGGPRS